MESKKYATDLSDDEWDYIEPYLPAPTGRGRPKIHGSRAILNAIFYVLKSGCPWRLLPKDFPPWKSVYDWFRKWRIDGTFERLNALSYASCYGPAWAGPRYLARASPIPKRPRRPASAANKEDTTATRR